MAKKIVKYVGYGILAVAVVLNCIVLGGAIKYACNDHIYETGTQVERVEAAEKKEDAEKLIKNLLIWTASTTIVGGAIVVTNEFYKPKKKR